MSDIANVKSYLSTGTGTEGSLLIPKKIMDTLIPEVSKNLIPRQLAAMVFGPSDIPGSSIDVDLETPDTMDFRLVAEASEFPIDQQEYTSFNMKPKKYGVGIRITKEFMEDGKWNLLERNIQTAGKRAAENENSLIISDALDNANSTTSGGAAITIANITESMFDLDDTDYETTDFLVGTEVLQDLRNIDVFVEADKAGDNEMMRTGFRGIIYGMQTHVVSTQAGMTKTSAYVIDRKWAYVIAEKRTLTVEGFDLPVYDMKGTTVSQRISVRHLRAKAISKITTT